MKPWEDKIRRVVPYTPGEQPQKDRMIKLNTNENPYPPSEKVTNVLRNYDAETLRLYPDPAIRKLTDALAAYHGIGPDMVFVGVGSDDVLAMAFMTFFSGGKPIVFPDITYSFYSVWADLFRIPYRRPALDWNFNIQKEDYYSENGGVILPNPNAPTSVYAPLSEIEDIVRHNQDVIVIIDEAYIDFAGESALALIPKYENLLVVRTYSKSRAMAGMRIGYAAGSPALIKALNDVKYSFNSYTLSNLAIEAGAAALADEAYFRDRIAQIKKTRAWTVQQLSGMGFEFPEPAANFVFARYPAREAKTLLSALREQDIYVRHFDAPRIRDYLRITIGTDAQMQTLVDVLKTLV